MAYYVLNYNLGFASLPYGGTSTPCFPSFHLIFLFFSTQSSSLGLITTIKPYTSVHKNPIEPKNPFLLHLPLSPHAEAGDEILEVLIEVGHRLSFIHIGFKGFATCMASGLEVLHEHSHTLSPIRTRAADLGLGSQEGPPHSNPENNGHIGTFKAAVESIQAYLVLVLCLGPYDSLL